MLNTLVTILFEQRWLKWGVWEQEVRTWQLLRETQNVTYLRSDWGQTIFPAEIYQKTNKPKMTFSNTAPRPSLRRLWHFVLFCMVVVHQRETSHRTRVAQQIKATLELLEGRTICFTSDPASPITVHGSAKVLTEWISKWIDFKENEGLLA